MSLSSEQAPATVVYCHCSDCRRVTGAPVAAFAAFRLEDVKLDPDPEPVSHTPGVVRRFCPSCGSPLTATFDYLPGQVYVPLGILDQAPDMPAERHCQADSALPWLHIADDLPRDGGSARDALQRASK